MIIHFVFEYLKIILIVPLWGKKNIGTCKPVMVSALDADGIPGVRSFNSIIEELVVL